MQRAFEKMINNGPLKFSEKGIEHFKSTPGLDKSEPGHWPWKITSINVDYTIDIISNNHMNVRSCDLDWFLW